MASVSFLFQKQQSSSETEPGISLAFQNRRSPEEAGRVNSLNDEKETGLRSKHRKALSKELDGRDITQHQRGGQHIAGAEGTASKLSGGTISSGTCIRKYLRS